MSKIRVLLVEDSATIRNHLREVLSADAEIEVAAEAATGAEAIEMCRRHQPDVITMDMVLSGLDGLAATEQIMAHWPTPILIVSSSTNRAQLLSTYDALAAGAVDVLEKPRGDHTDAAWESRLRSSVKLVSRIHVITHRPRGQASRQAAAGASPPSWGEEKRHCEVLAIGASTGGPGAVVDVLRELTPSLRTPVLLVQHLGTPFATAFADWLGQLVRRPVAYAQDLATMDSIAGQVIVAPPGRHLVVRDGRLRLTHDPERHSFRPSVDVLFESIADEFGAAAAACLLTGMGRDGATGLLRLRRAGAVTLAQDEATSVVYGMPREAASLSAADHILPPDEIGRRMASLTGSTTVATSPARKEKR